MGLDYMELSAEIDGAHRLHLWRRWSSGPRIVFVGLNPSTADGTTDDPTIRKCVGFARRMGAGRIDMLNLYTLRTPSPRLLRLAPERIHANADQRAFEVLNHPDTWRAIACWGVLKTREEDERALRVLSLYSHGWHALHTTRDGFPGHPLYLPYETAAVVNYPNERTP